MDDFSTLHQYCNRIAQHTRARYNGIPQHIWVENPQIAVDERQRTDGWTEGFTFIIENKTFQNLDLIRNHGPKSPFQLELFNMKGGAQTRSGMHVLSLSPARTRPLTCNIPACNMLTYRRLQSVRETCACAPVLSETSWSLSGIKIIQTVFDLLCPSPQIPCPTPPRNQDRICVLVLVLWFQTGANRATFPTTQFSTRANSRLQDSYCADTI